MTRTEVVEGRKFGELVAIMRTGGWWIATATFAGLLLGAVVTAVMRPVYRVELALVISARAGNGSGTEHDDLERVLGTWVYVLSDPSTFDAASRRMANKGDAEDLASIRLAVRPVDRSMVVVATVRAAQRELALEFAQALSDVANDGAAAQLVPATKIGPPQVTGDPESPKRGRNLLLGSAVGFLIGTAFTFVVADFRRARWS